MQDWVGAVFLLLLAAGAIIGLKALSKPRSRTAEEFERNAAEGTMVGAGINALQQAIDPAAARAKEVQMQMNDGRFAKKRREGKAADGD